MNKHSFTTWVRPLVLVLCAIAGLGSFASTVFVKSTSGAPYVKVGSGSWTATMQASETDWYYVDVTSGSSITLASSSSGSNASPSITFDSSADSYFIYDSNYGANITSFKSGTSTRTFYFLFEAPSNWQNSSATTIVWDGKANVTLSAVGGNSSTSSVVYLYATDYTDYTVTGTIYIKRCDPNSGSTWNEAGVTYNKGGYYESGTDCKPYYTNSAPYASITWPTKPTWYIRGNWDGTNWNNAEAMTNTSGTTWTITKNLTSGNIYFFLSYQNIGSNWHPRYSANQDVSAGGTWTATRYATSSDGDPSFQIPSSNIVTGTYTFTFDASTNKLTVTVPTVSASSATLYIYSETEPTMSGVTFTQEANDNSDNTKDGLFYWYKGVYSNTTWSGNVSFTANGSTKTLALGTDLVDGGTYYFDASNTATTADYNPYAGKTITVYVRSTDFPNAKLHAWYTPVDKTYSNENNININGTYGDASQAMTGDVEINGYHWFKKEFTGYNAIYAMLSGGDKGASGMFTTQGSPFDGTMYYYIDADNNNAWVASATAPAAPASSATLYIYSTSAPTMTDVTFTQEANDNTDYTKDGLFYWYKGVYSSTNWTGDVSFTANGSTKTLALGTDLVNGGTYYFDATNTATTADYNPYANKTITIYVRSTDFPGAKLHAWYTPVDKTYSDANNIAINGNYGEESQAMTGDEVINDYHWYKKEFTGYNAIYAMLSGGEKGASGMFTAQGSPFDGTLYYYIDARGNWRARTTAPVNPNTGEMYLIGLAAPEGQKLTNEWAANVGIKMTKVTDSNGTYFKADNVKLMSLNSGFAFATSLANSADDWETLNDCRYGAVVVNDGDTQKILYHSMIQYGTAGNDDDPTHWHQMYEVGQSENTFTVESTDVYNIIIFPAHGSEPTKVHLHTATELKDVMYILTGTPTDNGTKANFDLRTPVQMTHDSDNDVFTAEVSFSPGTLLTFSRDLLDWTLINSSRIGAPANTGDEGYWITNDNLKTQITGLQSEQASWSDKNNNNFCIKTNKSGLFKVTLSTTESWVKFEQLWVSKGDKVHVYLEKIVDNEGNDINPNPLISAYDKESWSDEDGGGNIHVDRPKFSVLIGTDTDNSNKHRLCLAKDQAPAAELHTTADGRTWYSWELDHTIADFILTKNGKEIKDVTHNSDDTDTDDTDATKIQWRKSGEIYLHWENGQLTDYTRDYDESAAQEAPVVTKMLDGRYYCYFINTAKWPQSYIHAWVTNAQGENVDVLGTPYPGKKMTDLVGYDDAGNEVWLYDFGSITSMEEPTGIIFSIGMNGGMQTGDYKFVNGAVYDYTGTVVLGRDLGNIIAKGVKDGSTRYIIEDDIVAVYYDANEKALYCKDLNKYITIPGSVERSVQQDDEVDYARTTTNKLAGQMASDRYDQSNWIKLKVHEATGAEYYDATDYQEDLMDFARNRNVLKAGTVRGVLPNVKNPTMEIVKLDNGTGIQTNGTSTYANNVSKKNATLNVFTPAHFVGSQPGLVSGRNYFFVTPKPNEYARVTWAVCTAVNGNTATFRIPESKYQGGGEFDNEDKLKGGFTADLSKVSAVPAVGTVYSFPAIITLKESSSASPAPRRSPSSYNGGDAGTPKYDYVVYPLSLSDVTTGVTEVNTSKTVANVTYVNIAGMQSNEPFDGVNIVVTTYTDGTRSAVKVIK